MYQYYSTVGTRVSDTQWRLNKTSFNGEATAATIAKQRKPMAEGCPFAGRSVVLAEGPVRNFLTEQDALHYTALCYVLHRSALLCPGFAAAD
jgi:hypothetical protein